MDTPLIAPQPWLEQVFGSFISTRLDMRLFGRAEDFHPDTATLGAMATYVHEHMHFFQTLFTGYGHIQWSAHRQASGYSVRMWEELASTGLGYRIPFAAYADAPSAIVAAQVIEATAHEQALIGAARFNLPVGNWTFDELKTKLIKGGWVINPVVELGGAKVCLQCKDILEGQAHFVERTLVEELSQNPENAWDRTGVPVQYTKAFDYFIERCGTSRRSEFPVVCDLALQTSWVPVIPKTEEEWQRSSPAWRFVQITNLLALDESLTFGKPDDWPARFVNFAAQVFDKLGFLSLDEVINERLQAFTRVPQLLQIEQLMKTAMEFRAERPWMLANPAANLAWLEELLAKFKAPLVVINGALGRFGNATVSDEELLFELHFQALAKQLLGPVTVDEKDGGGLQCAFGQFKLERGCPYQQSHNCTTRFDPAKGPPVPTKVETNGEVSGCLFAFTLERVTGNMQSIRVVPGARFPNVTDGS